MIPKFLKIGWPPAAAGVWFALWALLAPWVDSPEKLITTAMIGASVGALWTLAVLLIRLRRDASTRHFTFAEQIMFDSVCYPLIVLIILTLIGTVG